MLLIFQSVHTLENDGFFSQGLDRGVRIEGNGRIQDGAPEQVAVGAYICTSAG
jgi:hypothetical protein